MEPITKAKAVGWTAATILAPLVLSLFVSSIYIGYWYAQTGHRGQPPPDVIFRSMMLATPLALWIVAGAWWLFHRGGSSFAELYWIRTGSIGKDVLIGVVVGGLWTAVYGFGEVVEFGEMFVLDRAKLGFVPASVSAGFCEEFLFRGFLIGLIARAGGGRGSQLVYSSLAFALAHCFWGPWGVFWTAVLGFTLGLVTLWRGNVWSAVVAHTVLNLCIEPALLSKALTGDLG
jgi:membrane protease YdiL (CAAX protease family)